MFVCVLCVWVNLGVGTEYRQLQEGAKLLISPALPSQRSRCIDIPGIRYCALTTGREQFSLEHLIYSEIKLLYGR